MFNSNSNSNFIMFAVYYRDLHDHCLFRPESVFESFRAALDFYDTERTGYIKKLSNGKIVFSCNF